MRIVKAITFDAAHFLDDRPARDGAQNISARDGAQNISARDGAQNISARDGAQNKPARPYGRLHGHSFTLEAMIEGEPDPETGWVADFADLAASLEALKARLDHRLLNEIEGLERPTLENICRFAADHLRASYPGLRQIKVSRPSNGETCLYDVPPA